MSDLSKVLTPTRVAKLEKAGVFSIFELLTTFPRRLQRVEPLTPLSDLKKPDTQYFLTAPLVRIEQRRGKRPFLVLHFGGSVQFSGYYFVTSRYVYAQLKTGIMYQVLADKQQAFWNIKSVVPAKEEVDTSNFILGKAAEQSYLVPVYPKNGELKSSYWVAIHRQLPKQIYSLDMKGLIPDNDFIPQHIDLHSVHHPLSVEQFIKTKRDWISLRIFLKLALIKYVSLDQQALTSVAGKLDLDYLKQLESQLPFALSPSQDKVINDLLNNLCIV